MTGVFPEDVVMSPVGLGRGFGLLHHDRASVGGDIGVVLCSGWGIQELSSRKMLFRLASRLAAAGMPTIRFDYPGTADLVDQPAESFESWIATARDAADLLRNTCGSQTILFAGLGIGATVAMLAAARRDDVAGLVLMAPVVSGRRYLREIALAAPVVDAGLGLTPGSGPDGVAIGGIVMPPAVASDLRTVELMTADVGAARPVLAATRPSQAQEAGFLDRLGKLGWQVDAAEFQGYDKAMDNPTLAEMPTAVIGTIVTWCGALAAKAGRTSGTAPVPPRDAVEMVNPGFRDKPVVFGHRLFGLLTLPDRRADVPTVVFLNSGYDPHGGWANQWTRASHVLASEGIASLRFDMANVGDSAPVARAPEQVLYNDVQQADVRAALDFLASRGETSFVLVGRCSGAFVGLHAATQNDRVAAAILINQQRLIWDPDEDVDVALRAGPRTMADYRRRALSGETLQRLMSGDIDVRGVARGLVTQLGRRIMRHVGPLTGTLSKTNRLRRQCHAMMHALSGRRPIVHFVCSQGDPSLEQLASYFGGNLAGIGRFPNTALTILADTDHNVTPLAAQDKVVEIIRTAVLDTAHRHTAAAPEPESVWRDPEPEMAGRLRA